MMECTTLYGFVSTYYMNLIRGLPNTYGDKNSGTTWKAIIQFTMSLEYCNKEDEKLSSEARLQSGSVFDVRDDTYIVFHQRTPDSSSEMTTRDTSGQQALTLHFHLKDIINGVEVFQVCIMSDLWELRNAHNASGKCYWIWQERTDISLAGDPDPWPREPDYWAYFLLPCDRYDCDPSCSLCVWTQTSNIVSLTRTSVMQRHCTLVWRTWAYAACWERQATSLYSAICFCDVTKIVCSPFLPGM